MAIGIEDRVVISDPGWPAKAVVAPGDFSRYAPIGLGMAGPPVMMPWDKLESLERRQSFYSAFERTGDPIHDAPVNGPAGGLVYFDSGTDPESLGTMLTFLKVSTGSTRYATYAVESEDPLRDRFLAQLRIVEFSAMNLFGASPAPSDAPYAQPLSIGQLVAAFVDAQQTHWNPEKSSVLRGTLGGDGDWASEKLAFGFMVENGYRGVYRLWSRPWLVTK